METKWLYNHLVSYINRLNIPANKIDVVQIKVGESFEEREITLLGSQVKQEIADRIKDNLGALKRLKEEGHKVGRLKPRKFVNSIPLKQFGVTYSVDFKRNRVRIQKLGSFRVLGLHQIPEGSEIGVAVLVRKPSGYYLHVTCYVSKEYFEREKIGDAVGVDFGVKNKLTLSNGLAIDFEVRESKRLKRLQRLVARKKKGSKNRQKTLNLLRREYEKLSNGRKDAQNKVLTFLRYYDVVSYQDDPIRAWTKLLGGRVHSSGIGGVKSRLSHSLKTPIVLRSSEPTTKECFVCGRRKELSLGERVCECGCGGKVDRDLNSALNIMKGGLARLKRAVGVDRTEPTPVERKTAARILGSNPYIRISPLVEAGSPLLQ